MRNVTAFWADVFCILFAGALGLMYQPGDQGVNDCGNDIYMWYCNILDHDLVHRFVDWHMLKFL